MRKANSIYSYGDWKLDAEMSRFVGELKKKGFDMEQADKEFRKKFGIVLPAWLKTLHFDYGILKEKSKHGQAKYKGGKRNFHSRHLEESFFKQFEVLKNQKEVIEYCRENGIDYKLGIDAWYFSRKHKTSAKEREEEEKKETRKEKREKAEKLFPKFREDYLAGMLKKDIAAKYGVGVHFVIEATKDITKPKNYHKRKEDYDHLAPLVKRDFINGVPKKKIIEKYNLPGYQYHKITRGLKRRTKIDECVELFEKGYNFTAIHKMGYNSNTISIAKKKYEAKKKGIKNV